LYLNENYKDEDGFRLDFDNLTISLLVTRHPKKLLAHLKAKGYGVTVREPGVHVITGAPCAAQIVETRKLAGAGDIVLKSARDDLTLEEAARLADSVSGKTSRFVSGYMERLIDLNAAVFKEVNQMGKGLEWFLMETGIQQKWENEGMEKGMAKGVEQVLALVEQGYSPDKIRQILREKKVEQREAVEA
jgi:hypothetical protein